MTTPAERRPPANVTELIHRAKRVSHHVREHRTRISQSVKRARQEQAQADNQNGQG